LRALAAQRGVQLSSASVRSSGGGGLSTRLELILILGGVALLAGAVLLARALWRRRRA
jgi:hypothetical protein